MASLALQHGVSVWTLSHAVTRDADGRPTTAIGQALDLLIGEAPAP